ncbi:hypothetical protein DFJ73DRAFT_390913 [Zopfochytrium polystomum]|nr:hypothetical protein DFJ73DRAFT_390913 [Zopfochytrium polystomum]
MLVMVSLCCAFPTLQSKCSVCILAMLFTRKNLKPCSCGFSLKTQSWQSEANMELVRGTFDLASIFLGNLAEASWLYSVYTAASCWLRAKQQLEI